MGIIKKIGAEIFARHKYVHGKKGKLEQPHKKLKQWSPNGNAGKVLRIFGLGTIDLSWFLFCLGKYTAKDLNTVLLDNKIINKMADRHQNLQIQDSDSNFKKFFKRLEKNSPHASARLKLWMLYALLTLMATGGTKSSEKDKDDNTNQLKQEQISTNDIEDEGTDFAIVIDEDKNNNVPEIKNNDKNTTISDVKYNITKNDFTTNFIKDNWDDCMICLLEFETWRDKAVVHTGESRHTYGPGVTWVYTEKKGRPGEYIQHECNGEYARMASNFSVAEKCNQAKIHSLHSCMPVMQRHLKKYKFKELSDHQILGLFVAGYQLPGALTDNYKDKKFVSNGIIHKLSDAGSNKQKQVDAFIAGKEVLEKWRAGTNKRRWWCAMIYMGYITPDDLIDLDRDAFSSININTFLKNGHFVYDAATVEYVLEHAKNQKRGSVKDFIISRKIHLNKKNFKHKKNIIANSDKNPSMVKTNEGLKAYKSRDYKKAIECYRAAISLDVNNMEAYSSLALSYKKLGDQTHSISDYEKVLETVKACNAQMNKNRDLLHDPDVKAATYYNAGLAREEIAKLQEKENKNADAIESYRLAKLNFKTAYANAEEVDNTERMAIYQEAQNRVDNAAETLKTKESQGKANKFKQGKNKILDKVGKKIIRHNNGHSI